MTDRTSPLGLPTRVGLAFVFLAGLAACSGGGGGGGAVVVSPPPPPPPAASPIEDFFGLRFGALFRVSANSDPADPATGDIGLPVDPTRDPIRLRT